MMDTETSSQNSHSSLDFECKEAKGSLIEIWQYLQKSWVRSALLPAFAFSSSMGEERTVFSQLHPGHSNCTYASFRYNASRLRESGHRQRIAASPSLRKRQDSKEDFMIPDASRRKPAQGKRSLFGTSSCHQINRT